MNNISAFAALALFVTIVALGIMTVAPILGEHAHYVYIGVPVTFLLYITPYLIRMLNLFRVEGFVSTLLLGVFSQYPYLLNVERLTEAIWIGIRKSMPEYVHMRKSFYLSTDIKTFQLYALFSTIRYLNEERNAILSEETIGEVVDILDGIMKDCQALVTQNSHTPLASFQIEFGQRLGEDVMNYIDALHAYKRQFAA